MMSSVPYDLEEKLKQHGQEHVLAFWDRLNDAERRQLVQQLQAINLEQLGQLYQQGAKSFELPAEEKIAPVPVDRLGDSREDRYLGEQALRLGEVAALVVAGGQGTRLGFDKPKGMYPIGPVSNKSLFQIHAEKVLALRRRFHKGIPLLVMTSDATHADTEAYFKEQNFFGMPTGEVVFFQQGTMPALDVATGKLLMEAPGKVFAGPNGHGGTLTALASSGLLDQFNRRGIKQIFYFQVDNPLVKICDPAFLSHHIAINAEVSSKVVPKRTPTDKLGNLVQVDGRCSIIEYSDLPEKMATSTDAQGKLRFAAGSPAIHIFSVSFLERITQGQGKLPFHVAKKKVPYIDTQGNPVQPEKENAYKFEMFIFDALPLADRWTVVETTREEEFEPLKNLVGADSPETAKQAISNLAAAWLEKAGVKVPRTAEGNAAHALEISPLHALDAEELARKVDKKLRVEGPLYFAGRS